MGPAKCAIVLTILVNCYAAELLQKLKPQVIEVEIQTDSNPITPKNTETTPTATITTATTTRTTTTITTPKTTSSTATTTKSTKPTTLKTTTISEPSTAPAKTASVANPGRQGLLTVLDNIVRDVRSKVDTEEKHMQSRLDEVQKDFMSYINKAKLSLKTRKDEPKQGEKIKEDKPKPRIEESTEKTNAHQKGKDLGILESALKDIISKIDTVKNNTQLRLDEVQTEFMSGIKEAIRSLKTMKDETKQAKQIKKDKPKHRWVVSIVEAANQGTKQRKDKDKETNKEKTQVSSDDSHQKGRQDFLGLLEKVSKVVMSKIVTEKKHMLLKLDEMQKEFMSYINEAKVSLKKSKGESEQGKKIEKDEPNRVFKVTIVEDATKGPKPGKDEHGKTNQERTQSEELRETLWQSKTKDDILHLEGRLANMKNGLSTNIEKARHQAYKIAQTVMDHADGVINNVLDQKKTSENKKKADDDTHPDTDGNGTPHYLKDNDAEYDIKVNDAEYDINEILRNIDDIWLHVKSKAKE